MLWDRGHPFQSMQKSHTLQVTEEHNHWHTYICT
jgi:hypothetical protein